MIAASAGSDVVVEAVVGMVAESVEGRCNVVQVRIVIPGSVVAAGVLWPDKVGLPGGVSPGATSWVALGLAAGFSSLTSES